MADSVSLSPILISSADITVFIHDRDRAKFKKCLNGTSHVEIALRIHRIALREKGAVQRSARIHGRDAHRHYERALPHCRRCLFVVQSLPIWESVLNLLKNV